VTETVEEANKAPRVADTRKPTNIDEKKLTFGDLPPVNGNHKIHTFQKKRKKRFQNFEIGF
jgi:hypothetical protein